jgi:hypothetical protein
MCAIYAPAMTRERLQAMNVQQVAKHYGIDPARVEWERNHALQQG